MSPIITLSNGKRVANFSSPHPFTFEDGIVLPAVSPEEAERLQVTFTETAFGTNGDVRLTFELSPAILLEINIWLKEHFLKRVDIVFCPLPMITVLQGYGSVWLLNSPFRAIRIEDRIKKLVSIHKQCI